MQIPSRVKNARQTHEYCKAQYHITPVLTYLTGLTQFCAFVRRTFFRTNYLAISFSVALTKHYIKSLLADNLLLHVPIDLEAHGESLAT